MKKEGGTRPPHGPPNDWFKQEFKLLLPQDLVFANEEMQGAYDLLRHRPFHTNRTGNIINDWKGFGPKDGSLTTQKYGDMTFKIGVGGLHSQETGVARSNVYSYDVVSYYPRIIINMGFEPDRFNGDFKGIYAQLYEQRVAAKKAGDKAKAEALKIVINGVFGKFGSAWSCVYDPQLMLSVTLSGQTLLLHLIDKCYQEGIEVISANTDGVVMAQDAGEVVSEWEKEHGLETELVRYDGYWGRDVNNYCALDSDGGWKGKGIFSEPGVTKTPHADVSALAAKSYFTTGMPVGEYIEACDDIRSFILSRNAKGGAQWRGQKLGRMARWIWSTEGEPITYVSSCNKVADSNGAYPLITLPNTPNTCLLYTSPSPRDS